MRNTDEIPGCDIKPISEMLAVAFTECGRRKSYVDGERRDNRSGKSLFRRFVKENCTSVWKPDLVNSISTVRFGGHLRNPPTLLLQGDATQLQNIRDAWSNRFLRSPEGYHIDFVGDITRIGARPLTRGQFIPLCDAVCVSISNVTSRDDVATQEAVMIELERSFPGVHSPSRELIHETLGKLIRNRKVFCTGPGYHLVTTKTYSGKYSDGTDIEDHENNESHKCETCQQNRKIFENQVNERRSYRVKKTREHSDEYYTTTETNSVTDSQIQGFERDSDSLHGKALPDTHEVNQKVKKHDKRASLGKAVEPRAVSPKKSSSIVDKMAGKLFRRRKSSERRTSSASDNCSPKRNLRKNNQVKELNVTEAQTLGYESSFVKNPTTRRSSYREDRSSSESPVKRPSSAGRRRQRSFTSEGSDTTISRTFRYENGREITERHRIPDVIPETEIIVEVKSKYLSKTPKVTSLRRSKSKSESSKAKKSEKERKISKNNSFPKLRDVAVSCNLDDTDIETNYINTKGNTSSHRSTPPSTKNTKYLRRTKSLRLPRERHMQDMDAHKARALSPDACGRIDNQVPEYYSLRRSEASSGMAYDTIQRSATTQKIRRSISSASTGREYSYLHACHFAPSVRVGSIIADHLEELERRRHSIQLKSGREMSPTSSMASSYISTKSNGTSSSNGVERSQHVIKLKSSNEDTKNRDIDEESNSDEAQADLDSETKAALKVAKRLAKLDIKMTRNEWKEYFSTKSLPDNVEKALSEATKQEEIEDEKNYSTRTCFANNSGSVETVIDVTQRSGRSRNSKASSKSSSSEYNTFQKAVQEYEEHDTGDLHHADYGSLRGTNRDFDLQNNNHEPHNMLYKCPDVITEEEENDSQVFYNCDHGHRHLPYNNQHKQLVAIDNASLTEDSGFHSARERNSYSFNDTTRKQRGTFV